MFLEGDGLHLKTMTEITKGNQLVCLYTHTKICETRNEIQALSQYWLMWIWEKIKWDRNWHPHKAGVRSLWDLTPDALRWGPQPPGSDAWRSEVGSAASGIWRLMLWGGVRSLRDLTPDALSAADVTREEIKCTVSVMCLSHPETTPHPLGVCGKIGFHQTGLWFQKRLGNAIIKKARKLIGMAKGHKAPIIRRQNVQRQSSSG